jgi:hypothetical protein
MSYLTRDPRGGIGSKAHDTGRRNDADGPVDGVTEAASDE